MLMTKKQAIAIITKCAKQYQQYLEGNQVVFVYRDKYNKSNHTVVRFHSHNFLHFTGVNPRAGMNTKQKNDLPEPGTPKTNPFPLISFLQFPIFDVLKAVVLGILIPANTNGISIDFITNRSCNTFMLMIFMKK